MKQRRLIQLPALFLFLLSSQTSLAFSNSSNLNLDLVNSIVNTMDMNYVRQEIIDLSQCIGAVDLKIPVSGTCTNGVSSVKAWRLSGSQEEKDVVDHLVSSFTSILGANAVKTEPSPIDMWRFRGASLTVKYGNQTSSYPAASIAGSSIPTTAATLPGGTLPGGCKRVGGANGMVSCDYDIVGNLVWVNKGLANDYKNLGILDSSGKLPPNTIVFYSWDDTVDWASAQCYEAKAHGATAVIQTTLPELGSFYYYSASNGGGTFDMVGDGSSCPPMITLSPRDARTILNVLAPSVLNNKNPPAPTAMSAEFKLGLDTKENTVGYNVLAKITGSDYPNELIIFSGHHDAYFQGAADDEAANALMLGMAKAIKDSGYKPKRTFLFISVTGEEYGVFDAVYDWLAGSFNLAITHPEWSNAFNGGEFAVAQINVGDVVPAAIGGRIQYSATNDLLDPANNWYSSYAKDIDPQLVNFIATFVDQYTYYHFAGIPNVGFDEYALPYYHNYYHTDGDTIAILDFDLLKQVAKVNLITALAFDNATVLPYDYGQAISRLKNYLNLTTIKQLVGIGQSAGLANCTDQGIDSKLNSALSTASNANAQMQNTNAPTNQADIMLVNKYLREASRVYSTLSTSDGAITPQTSFAHVPSERDVLNMNAAIAALQSNNPSKALSSLLQVTPYVNVFITNFSEAAFKQRLSDYDAPTGIVGAKGPKSSAWGVGSTPASGFYTEYQSIQNKVAQGNNNFQPEISSIQTKRNNALNYYCGAVNKTLQAVTDLTTNINQAISTATAHQ